MEDPIQMVTPDPKAIEDIITTAASTVAGTSNSTNKFIPTPEGMACAYMSLMIMALVPIFVGSFKSIRHQVETHIKFKETGEQAETMTDKDAAIFPIIASCALFGFYILIKLSPDLVNLVVSGYFFLLGVFAFYRLIKPTTFRIFPTKYNLTQYTFLFGSKNLELTQTTSSSDSSPQIDNNRSGSVSPSGSNSSSGSDLVPTEIMVCSKFTHSDILAFILASALGVWYILTKHWVANNAFGLAFALNGIELLPVNSIRIGCILLCGLFFYDVFWVFGTDVMVSVAKKFDAPIKILFPQDFLVSGFWGKNFAMLGLGDIVIPGIFIAFLLRFDKSLNRKRNVYFWACFLAYVFGLALTIAVMSYFKHAQPALLYLVPCCILIPLILAVMNGDFGALLKYRDHPLPPLEGETSQREPGDASESEAADDDDDNENDDDVDDDVKQKGNKSSRSIRSTRANSKKDK